MRMQTEPCVSQRGGHALRGGLDCCRRNLAYIRPRGHTLHGWPECLRRTLALPCAGGRHTLHGGLECCRRNLAFPCAGATLCMEG